MKTAVEAVKHYRPRSAPANSRTKNKKLVSGRRNNCGSRRGTDARVGSIRSPAVGMGDGAWTQPRSTITRFPASCWEALRSALAFKLSDAS